MCIDRKYIFFTDSGYCVIKNQQTKRFPVHAIVRLYMKIIINNNPNNHVFHISTISTVYL